MWAVLEMTVLLNVRVVGASFGLESAVLLNVRRAGLRRTGNSGTQADFGSAL